MRPVFALMACEATGKDPISALGAATAVELFHNFTLLHDDIMDGQCCAVDSKRSSKWTLILYSFR